MRLHHAFIVDEFLQQDRYAVFFSDVRDNLGKLDDLCNELLVVRFTLREKGDDC